MWNLTWLQTCPPCLLKTAQSRSLSSPLFFTSPSQSPRELLAKGLYFALEQTNKRAVTAENDTLANALSCDYVEA